jgi:flagellar motor protein MotB
MLQQQVAGLEQQNRELVAQAEELQARADALDEDNQQLEVLVAQGRQREQVVQDQLEALQGQLGDTAEQLVRVQRDLTEKEQRVDSLTASTRRRGGASISANDSELETLPQIDVPGGQVHRDGDTIRVELPSDLLFAAGQAELLPAAAAVLDDVAAEVAATYGDHRLGIEGHTDNAKPARSQYPNNHQLSVARATAVYEYLAARTSLKAGQLAIAGYGSSRPQVSNATPEGRQRNRRVELVIYPERVARR